MSNFILDYLQQFFEELQPLEFYREIFPIGELAEKEQLQSGKYNAIAVELQPTEEKKVNAKRYLITDDLHKLHELLESENFIIISPISYCGRSRESINARFIYAIAIDLDGITELQHIRDLFYQMDNDITPLPTFTVCSGSGLHLYYQLKQPLPCFKNIIVQLAALKKELTKSIWNKYTTDLYKNVQIESLFQGFLFIRTIVCLKVAGLQVLYQNLTPLFIIELFRCCHSICLLFSFIIPSISVNVKKKAPQKQGF